MEHAFAVVNRHISEDCLLNSYRDETEEPGKSNKTLHSDTCIF